MAVIPVDPPYPKTPCCMQTSRPYLSSMELDPIEILHCGNWAFRICFLLLWTWPWPDGLHMRTSPVSLKIFPQTKNELSASKLSRVIVRIQTNIHRCQRKYYHVASRVKLITSSSAIAERPLCRVGLLVWPKVEDELGDNILRTS